MQPMSVCGVMVTFRPDEGWESRLADLLAQMGRLVVVDNSLDAAIRLRLEQACAAHAPRLIYLPSPENNLAMAQNIGIRHALSQPETEAVLLLDDDSTPADGMVVQLLQAVADGVGLVAPVMVDRHSQRPTRYVVLQGGWPKMLSPSLTETLTSVLHVIASGSLIPRAVFEQVGMMDEGLVIDYIDKEFCLRLREAGFDIRVVGAAKLYHAIGQCEDHTLGGVRITTTNHPPARRFTIYRNRIRCLRRYGLKVPAFALHEMGGIGYDWLRIALFEQDKRAKFKAIWQGLKAGLCTPC